TVIAQALETGSVIRLANSPRLVSTATIDRIKRHITELLTRRAEESHDAWSVEESVVQQAKAFGSAELIRLSLKSLIDTGGLVRLGRMVAVASDENSLSKRQQARMEQIVKLFDGNRSPPTTKDIAAKLDLTLDTVTSLSRFAVQTGILLDTGNGLLVSNQVFRELCDELNDLFATNSELPVADIRDRWQVTRKHAIPFLEFCDRMNVTNRKENVRIAGSALGQFVSESLP
ncbi:MAG: hypothetical protein GY826_41155, partial [Fuerstiella sp.]|nr:hypothetical protein [Fuerstiella sp.]